MRFSYPVTLTEAERFEPSDSGFVVTFPDFPEGITQGEDRADALCNAADALEEILAHRIVTEEDIPEPSAGSPTVAPSLTILGKAALYLAMRETRTSKSALAAKLGWDEKEIRRLLDPKHPSKLPRLEQALAALGKQLVAEMRDAA